MSAALNRRNRILKAMVTVGTAGGASAAGLAYAAQPHMEAALNALLTAQSELKVGEHNKDGHRAKAPDPVNRAIEQVRPGSPPAVDRTGGRPAAKPRSLARQIPAPLGGGAVPPDGANAKMELRGDL